MDAGSLFFPTLQKQLILGKKSPKFSPLRPIPNLDVTLFVRGKVTDV